jgi:methyl-accepting chemotaxis protein
VQAKAIRGAERHGGTDHKLSERIAAATEELASGLAEASAAAEELRRSMEQIASGAEEAAGASQEQLGAIKQVLSNLTHARSQAEGSHRRTEAVQIILGEIAGQITSSVRAIERNAERQGTSVTIIAELERQAQDIGDISRTVARISDQTNLLALNAAIEAARAEDHGLGFAVVADEVRALAEVSEKSAQEIQNLVSTIQSEVRDVAQAVKTAIDNAVSEARTGAVVVDALDGIRTDVSRIAEGSADTATAALQAERAAIEAQRGAEQVASAAEEQSAAASEAQSAIGQQAQSLDQGKTAAEALASLSEGLRRAGTSASAAEQIGSTAEELSATVQELSSAARQIMSAIEQINKGSQIQAAATQQTSAALTQIENSARVAQKNATTAVERVSLMQTALTNSRGSLERLVNGIDTSLKTTQASLTKIARLQLVGRNVEKIIDAIGLITVQTSMLAVSGSVEAARAGDSGRGFAVVSNDIRKLARDASGSVERAKDTVRGILDQIASLLRDLEQINVSTEIEVQKSRSIFTALNNVDSDITSLRAANGQIQEGAEAILRAAVETAAGARQIASAAEEASAASREAATASHQQAQGAEDLAAAIEEIASLADELKLQNA